MMKKYFKELEQEKTSINKNKCTKFRVRNSRVYSRYLSHVEGLLQILNNIGWY